jgi:hypothetical protein
VRPLFEFAAGSACAKGLSPVDRDRLALLRALNETDGEAMIAIATRALAALPPQRAGWRADYVMAAMAGHIAAGRRAEALALLESQLQLLTPTDRNRLGLRLLVGHAAPHMARPASR